MHQIRQGGACLWWPASLRFRMAVTCRDRQSRLTFGFPINRWDPQLAQPRVSARPGGAR
jgi:hypothetical protein